MISEISADHQVHNCTFEVYINSASMIIKFPCSYFIEWRSMNGKILMASSQEVRNASNSVVQFKETIRFQTELLYNFRKNEYVKKQSLLLLNLISKRRPDQQKLVGRITVNLADIANHKKYNELIEYKLDYCSVNASVGFKGKMVGKKASPTAPQNFDQDSFNDYQSFIAGLHRDSRFKGQTLHDSHEEKTVQIGTRVNKDHSWKTKKEELHMQRGIIEESHNEDLQSKMNTQRNTPRSIKAVENHFSNRSQSEKMFNKTSFLHESMQKKEDSMSRQIEEKKQYDEQKQALYERINNEKKQSDKYREKCLNLEKKISEYDIRCDSFLGKIQNHQKELILLGKEKDLQIRQWKMKSQRLRLEKENLQVELQKAKKSEKGKQFQDFIIKYQTQNSFLKNEKELLEKQINQLLVNLKKEKLHVESQKKEKQYKENEIRRLEINLKRKQKENVEDFEEKIRKLTEEKDQKEKIIDSYIEQINKKTRKLQNQQKNQIAQKEQLLKKQEKINELFKQNNEKETQIIDLKRLNNKVKLEKEEEINHLSRRQSELLGEIDNLKQESLENEEFVKSLEKGMIDSFQSIQAAEKISKEKQKIIQQLSNELREIKQESLENEEYVKSLEKGMIDSFQSIQAVEKITKEKQEVIQQLSNDLLILEERLREKQKQMNLRKEELLKSSEVEQQKTIIEKFAMELNERQSEVSSLKEQLQMNKVYEENLQQEILKSFEQKVNESGIKEENERLNNELVKQIQKYNQQKMQMVNLQEKVEENEHQMQMLKNSHRIQVQQLKQKVQKVEKDGKSTPAIKEATQSESEKEVKILRKKIQTVEEDNKKLKKEIILLQNNAKYDDQDYVILQDQLSQKDQKIYELEKQLERKNEELNEDGNDGMIGVVRIFPAYSESSKPEDGEQKVEVIQLQKEDMQIRSVKNFQKEQKKGELREMQQNLEEELQKNKIQLWRVENINEQLTKKLGNAENQISELKEQNFQFTLEKETLIKRYTYQKEQLLKEINSIRDKEVTRRLSEMINRPSSLKLEGDQSGSRIEQSKDETDLYVQKDGLQRERARKIEQYIKIIKSHEKTIDELNFELDDVKGMCIELEQRISIFKQKEEMMKESLIILEEESNRIMMVIEERDNLVQSLKEEIVIKENQCVLMQEKLSEYSTNQNSKEKQSKKIQQFVKEINLLRLQINQSEEQLLTNKKLVTMLQNANSQLQAQKTKLQLQTGQSKMQLQRRLEDLEEELFAYQSTQNEKQIMIKQMKDEIEKLQKMILQKKSGSSINIEEIQALKRQNEEYFNEYQTRQEQNKVYIQTLEEEVLKQYEKITELEERGIENQKMQNEFKFRCLQEEKEELQMKYQELERNYREKEAQLIFKVEEINGIQEILKEERLQYFKAKKQLNFKIASLQTEKGEQIRQENNIISDLKHELNFYSEELKILTDKHEKLQHSFERLHEQNEFYEKNLKVTNDENSNLTLKIEELQNLKSKNSDKSELEQLKEELALKIKREKELESLVGAMQEKINEVEEKSHRKINQIQKQLQLSYNQSQKLKAQFEEKEFQHINTQLNLHFKLKEKSQGEIVLKKSFTASQEQPVSDILPASKKILQILDERTTQGKSQQVLQMVMSKISLLEEQNYNLNLKEKGFLHEKTRLLSMQFSKAKSVIMRSKLNIEERSMILNNLKPLDSSIKEILNISETFADTLMEGSRSTEKIYV